MAVKSRSRHLLTRGRRYTFRRETKALAEVCGHKMAALDCVACFWGFADDGGGGGGDDEP